MISLEQPRVILIENKPVMRGKEVKILSAATGLFENLELVKDFLQERADLESLRSFIGRLSRLSGPTIVVLDMNLLGGVSREELGAPAVGLFAPDNGISDKKIDGLIVMKALFENTRVSPLLLVTATSLEDADYLADTNLCDIAHRAFGRTDQELRVIKNASLRDLNLDRRPEYGRTSLPKVAHWPTYLASLRQAWDEWVFRDSFLRYWLAAWNLPSDTEEPGHLDNPGDWPPGTVAEVVRKDQTPAKAFKCLFCFRTLSSDLREEEGRKHLYDVSDCMEIRTAREVIDSVVAPLGSQCALESALSDARADQLIHWPSNPGAAFVWRLKELLEVLDEPRPPIHLGLNAGTKTGTLRIELSDPWRFWAGVITKRAGGATTAFRDLVACRFPSQEDRAWTRVSEVAVLEAGVAKILELGAGAPNRVQHSRPQPLDLPMCDVTPTAEGLVLGWPVTPNAPQVD